MDEHALTATRRSLHAVAERLLAGPQYREHGEIRLQVTPGGFGQFRGPLRVDGTEIVGSDRRVPLRGTIGEVAAALRVEAASLPASIPSTRSSARTTSWPSTQPPPNCCSPGSPAVIGRCGRSRRPRSRSCGPNTSTSASPPARSTTGSHLVNRPGVSGDSIF